MTNLDFLNRPRSDLANAFLALAAYLLVLIATDRIFGGLPGDWSYALTYLLVLPVALFATRYGALAVRSDARPVTEGTAMAFAALIALLALGGSKPAIAGTFAHLPAAIVAAAAMALGEELLFRGSLLPALGKRFGFGVALVISAGLSGALSLDAGIAQGVAAFFAGLAMGGLYLRSGLGSCIAFHCIFNLLIGPAFGLSLDGVSWPGLLKPVWQADPLGFWPVQAAWLILALAWAPLGAKLPRLAPNGRP